MTAHLRLLAALTSGRQLSTDDAVRLLAERDAELTHELAEQQRDYANLKWVDHPANTHAQIRAARRMRGAALEVADMIDPEGSERAKPPAPEPPPVVAGESPADRLAREIEGQPDVELLRVDGRTTVTVHVRPQDLDAWHWWCHHFNVDPASVTSRGTHVTAKGSRKGVRVLLAGLGVSAFLRSSASSPSTIRLVPPQRDGGHDRSTD